MGVVSLRDAIRTPCNQHREHPMDEVQHNAVYRVRPDWVASEAVARNSIASETSPSEIWRQALSFPSAICNPHNGRMLRRGVFHVPVQGTGFCVSPLLVACVLVRSRSSSSTTKI